MSKKLTEIQSRIGGLSNIAKTDHRKAALEERDIRDLALREIIEYPAFAGQLAALALSTGSIKFDRYPQASA